MPKRKLESVALNEAQTNALIEEVRNHEALYLLGHDDYKKQSVKTKIWNTIGANLNINPPLAKSTWTSLKTTYNSNKRSIKSVARSGAGAREVPQPSWAYWNQLRFLDDKNIANASTTGNLDVLDNKECGSSENTQFVSREQTGSSSPPDYSNISQGASTSEPPVAFESHSAATSRPTVHTIENQQAATSTPTAHTYMSKQAPTSTQFIYSNRNGSMNQLSSASVRSGTADVDSGEICQIKSSTPAMHEVEKEKDKKWALYFSSLLPHTREVADEHKLDMCNEINRIVTKYAYGMKAKANDDPPAVPMHAQWPFPFMSPFYQQPSTSVKREPSSPIRNKKKIPKKKIECDYSSSESDCFIVEEELVSVKQEKQFKQKKKPVRKSNEALPAANLQLENNTEITLTLLQAELATLKRQQQLQHQPLQERQQQQQPQQPCPAQVLQQQQLPQLQHALLQSHLAQNDQHVHAQQATSQGQQQQSQQLVQLQLQMQQQEQQLQQQQQALKAALMKLQPLPPVEAQMNVSNPNPLELPAPVTPNSPATVEEPNENEK